MTVVNAALVSAHVAEILDKIPDAAIIGLIADPGAWTGPDTLEVAGRPVSVAACPSPLAIRVAIAEHDDDGPLVILTDVDQADLGAEVRAKLAKNRLVPLSRWRAVLSLFAATRLDPAWPAVTPSAMGCSPSPRPAGTPPPRPPSSTSTPSAGPPSPGSSGPTSSTGASRRCCGPCGSRQRSGISTAHRPRCATRRSAGFGTGSLPAAIRLETYLGKGIRPEDALTLAAAAETLVADRSDPHCRRAEAILVDVEATGFAWVSDVLPAGFDARLRRFGAALERALVKGPPSPKQLVEVEAAAHAVTAHREAAAQPRRRRNVEMAARLARRLAMTATGSDDAAGTVGEAPAASFLDAAEAYVGDGGFVDWARVALSEGDTDTALVGGYTRLAKLTGDQRRADDERFGRLLADWAPAGATSDRAILAEDVLDQVVRPLVGAGAKVCLVVLDGMSQAVFRPLLDDLVRRGWAELGRGPAGRRPPGVTAFPTITDVCRTSLLCGRLVDGTQVDEKRGFAEAFPGGVLFHKNNLVGGAGAALPEAVIDALDPASGPDVVGVVINAIDDHLMKGDQVLVDWTADVASPLAWVLQEGAGRIVVLTADHGHVPDTGTMARVAEGGERWRVSAGGPAQADEVLLTGPRVLRGDGSVVLPWADDVRHSASKRMGYHGGASPREVVVPLAVLTSGAPAPAGWIDVPTRRSRWWDPAVETVPLPGPLLPTPPHRRSRPV